MPKTRPMTLDEMREAQDIVDTRSCTCDGGGTLCTACAAEQRLKRGWVYVTLADGLSRAQRWRRKNKPQLAVKQAAYYRKNPTIYLLNACRSRARAAGIDFNITKEDIVIPEFCPVLGIKLEHGTKGFHESSPSVDRFDSTKGYVKGNVVVMSFRANRMKQTATLDEVRKLLAFMEKWEQEKSLAAPPLLPSPD
jgi:hypothetical protein